MQLSAEMTRSAIPISPNNSIILRYMLWANPSQILLPSE